MFEEAKFWFGDIVVFVIVTFLVVGLLQLTEWLTKLVKEPVNPVYVAAGGACAFIACLEYKREGR